MNNREQLTWRLTTHAYIMPRCLRYPKRYPKRYPWRYLPKVTLPKKGDRLNAYWHEYCRITLLMLSCITMVSTDTHPGAACKSHAKVNLRCQQLFTCKDHAAADPGGFFRQSTPADYFEGAMGELTAAMWGSTPSHEHSNFRISRLTG
jgi:hypothetical protein